LWFSQKKRGERSAKSKQLPVESAQQLTLKGPRISRIRRTPQFFGGPLPSRQQGPRAKGHGYSEPKGSCPGVIFKPRCAACFMSSERWLLGAINRRCPLSSRFEQSTPLIVQGYWHQTSIIGFALQDCDLTQPSDVIKHKPFGDEADYNRSVLEREWSVSPLVRLKLREHFCRRSCACSPSFRFQCEHLW
jgi:hypothetical protein